MFPNDKEQKWKDITISCSPETVDVMKEIISKTSLIRQHDLQTIANIIANFNKKQDN